MDNYLDKYFYQKLGGIMHQIRIQKGYSLRYLSQLSGVSKTTIDNYEMGNKRIKKSTWKNLCKALEITEKIEVAVF